MHLRTFSVRVLVQVFFFLVQFRGVVAFLPSGLHRCSCTCVVVTHTHVYFLFFVHQAKFRSTYSPSREVFQGTVVVPVLAYQLHQHVSSSTIDHVMFKKHSYWKKATRMLAWPLRNSLSSIVFLPTIPLLTGVPHPSHH